MCGIAGFVDFAGHAPDQARDARRAHDRRHRASRARRRGLLSSTTCRARSSPARHHRCGSGPAADGWRGRPVQIVFNGEIYNYLRAARASSRRAGIASARTRTPKSSSSPTFEWGEACVERLHGMFAFAIWDTRSHALFLARDRVGKKPLYYYRQGSLVAFASELKALRAAGWCPDADRSGGARLLLLVRLHPGAEDHLPGRQEAARGAHPRASRARRKSSAQYWKLEFGEPASADARRGHRGIRGACSMMRSLAA